MAAPPDRRAVRRFGLGAGALLLAAGAGLALGFDALRGADLRDLSIASGWVLAAVVLVAPVALLARGRRYPRGAKGQLVISVVASALFLVHVDFRAPRGVTEVALAAAFVAVLVSAIHGSALLLRGGEGPDGPRVARWLLRHAALNGVLATLTIFHGVFVHAHGALAHVFLGASVE